MHIKLKSSQRGFTIIELTIATTVFSTMLLLASTGIIQIGKIYYKGVVTERTQEATRSVIDDIARNYQVTGSKTFVTPADLGSGEKAFCIGDTRYSYKAARDQIVSATKHALWVDIMNPGATCTPLVLSTANPADGATRTPGKELLARNMRLSQLTVTQTGGDDTLNIEKVRVIYGEEDLSPGIEGQEVCQSTRFGGQFCAISTLNSFVKGRL